MSEYMENDENMVNEDAVAVQAEASVEAEAVVDAEVAEEAVETAPVVEDAAETAEDEADEDEATEEQPVDIDEQLFDKVQRAARLLRNRKAAMAKEAEADQARMNDLLRALKLLDLKSQMEQKEMSDLLGMRLRELDALLHQAEEAGVVRASSPEEEDMRLVLGVGQRGCRGARLSRWAPSARSSWPSCPRWTPRISWRSWTRSSIR